MANTRTITFGSSTDAASAEFRAPYLVSAMACRTPTLPPARYSIAEVEQVLLCRDRERSCERVARDGAATLRLGVPDPWMSSEHARLVREAAGWFVEDTGSKNGTHVNGRETKRVRLVDGDLIEVGGTVLLYRDAEMRVATEAGDVDLAERTPTPLSTLSLPLSRQFELVRRVAATDTPILVLGASGTGKELTARAIHELAGRGGPFIAINCGAIPDTLVESELFGHRKGAFSGATTDKVGLVRAADGGTLFLDEVADLPPASQTTLLRVLQEREVVPVGATEPIRVDVRVVAATHQELDVRTGDGRFRRDLFARLAGFTVELPSLADRREDIGLIVAVLLRRIAGAAADDIRIDRAVARALFAYDWPMNVRELEHALRAAIALAAGEELELEHFPKPIRAALEARPAKQRRTPGDEQYELLEALLERHAGNVSAIARDLSRSRVHVHRLLKRYGLDAKSYRG